MFDPMTVCFEIDWPFKGKRNYRYTIIRIWHKDPCKDGTDNSCDWFGSKRKLNEKEKALSEAIWHLETILDNRPFYPDHPAHLRFQAIKNAMWDLRKREGFRIHPRWHIWHWRIQVPFLQYVYRWLFERCCVCKRGFKWKESVCGNWDGDKIWHNSCDQSLYKNHIGG